ncbi:MAG: hypothetical protein ACXWKB_07525, partial [Methyloceanibacter sp.]
SEELDAKRGVAKDQQRRRRQLYPRFFTEPRLINRHEEHDALPGDILLQQFDRLLEIVDACNFYDASAGNGGLGYGRTRRGGQVQEPLERQNEGRDRRNGAYKHHRILSNVRGASRGL